MRLQALQALKTIVLLLACASVTMAAADYAVKLQTGDIIPQANSDVASTASSLSGKHVLVQFDQPVTQADRDRLSSQGVTILDYVPDRTWIARIDRPLTSSDVSRLGLKWVSGITADQKISPLITNLGIRESSKRSNGRAQFAIILQKDQDLAAWADRLKNDYAAEILGTEPSTSRIDLIIPETTYLQLAQLDEVQWIEQASPIKEETNNSARDNIGATAVQAAPYNLDGTGIMVAEWDGGRAKGDHPDLDGRVISVDAASYATHATHVAGTIIGNGTASGGVYRGMAPGATLMTQLWWNTASDAATQYTQATTLYHARTANNSWGYGVGDPASQAACEGILGTYFTEDATLDNIVRGDIGNPISIVYSAGNQRGSSTAYCGSIGWTYNTVDPLASSKNVISVGAINSNNSTMTSFSSWGPTDDGRIKPDIVGPGCQSNDDHGVTSCNLSGGYTTMCGTSMSGPAVTGVVALMYEQQHISFPSGTIYPSTVRGILINTAIDLGATGPDYQYGWGKVDAVGATKKISIGSPSWVESQITEGATQSYDLTVPGNAAKLKVTLAWDDIGGTAISGNALINDLDLVLIDPFGATKQVWTLNGAQPTNAAVVGTDHINNVETAEINNPTPGLWKARVTGFAVPNGPQKYSLVFTPDSINTPGQSRAWAVFDNGDLTRNPGASQSIDFWVANTGGALDSARVRITDNAGWLTTTLDTTVQVPSHDSVHVVTSATVPANALAGQQSVITCRATSKSDTTIFGQNTVAITTGAIYGVVLDRPLDDSAHSPASYVFYVKVHNTGNSTSSMIVTPTHQTGWTITPASRNTPVAARDSVTVSFTMAIPAEVTDQTTDTIHLFSSSSGQVSDTDHFVVKVLNPVFPATLTVPDTIVYSQNRSFSFAWTGAADSYRLLIATDSNFTNVVRNYGGLTSQNFTMPAADSMPDNRYYWGVRKYVGADSSSLQLHARRIYVDNVKPNSISPSTPANGAISISKIILFTFSAPTTPGPTESPEVTNLQISQDSTFATGVTTFPQIFGTTFSNPDTLAEGRWYWRVQHVDLAGNTANYSSVPSFLIDTKTPNLPTQTYPADSATIGTTPVPLRWTTGAKPSYETSAEYFYVHISKLANFTDYSFTGFVYTDSMLLNTPFLVQGQRYYWRVKAIDSAGFFTGFTTGSNFLYQTYICGDVNNSHSAPDLADLSALVAYLTVGTPVPPVSKAASVNCDASIDLSDLSRLVSYLTGGNATLCCQ